MYAYCGGGGVKELQEELRRLRKELKQEQRKLMNVLLSDEEALSINECCGMLRRQAKVVKSDINQLSK